ncbi:translation initiation factor IF-2-like [Leopardus geoffroyi]|uniref:translation initiation factor IF-2-like n=1 Tax=Leopardus geoffroyi TaxID=46844 RepID=UPI001E2654D4|nr:translation initiation factor IF-2-like [Leopardus geoffroyi]
MPTLSWCPETTCGEKGPPRTSGRYWVRAAPAQVSPRHRSPAHARFAASQPQTARVPGSGAWPGLGEALEEHRPQRAGNAPAVGARARRPPPETAPAPARERCGPRPDAAGVNWPCHGPSRGLESGARARRSRGRPSACLGARSQPRARRLRSAPLGSAGADAARLRSPAAAARTSPAARRSRRRRRHPTAGVAAHSSWGKAPAGPGCPHAPGEDPCAPRGCSRRPALAGPLGDAVGAPGQATPTLARPGSTSDPDGPGGRGVHVLAHLNTLERDSAPTPASTFQGARAGSFSCKEEDERELFPRRDRGHYSLHARNFHTPARREKVNVQRVLSDV